VNTEHSVTHRSGDTVANPGTPCFRWVSYLLSAYFRNTNLLSLGKYETLAKRHSLTFIMSTMTFSKLQPSALYLGYSTITDWRFLQNELKSKCLKSKHGNERTNTKSSKLWGKVGKNRIAHAGIER
jgi:hypothetical protein